MRVEQFLEVLKTHLDVEFYTGVPDSQLAPLCDTLYDKYGLGSKHQVTANEGAAVGLAAGHYIATGKPALVYLQNSGLGNIVNPVASLLDEKVYGIPCVFVVGWRGEPGVKDEPQHAFQGEITIELLDLLKIDSFILSSETDVNELLRFVRKSRTTLSDGRSIAFVVRKGGLKAEAKPNFENTYTLKREEALKTIVTEAEAEDVFVSTTGKTSRELFEIREALNQGHDKDFLTVGSMGHASMIAMGIAMNKPEKTVWCVDGDGAAIMHLGSMAVLAKSGYKNIIHVVMNNGAHESVGGMPVAYGRTDFYELARSFGYEKCFQVSDEEQLKRAVREARSSRQACFIEIKVALGSRSNLGRPTTTPKENKAALMDYLRKEINA